jgi:hypothetical protein
MRGGQLVAFGAKEKLKCFEDMRLVVANEQTAWGGRPHRGVENVWRGMKFCRHVGLRVSALLLL